MATFRALFRVLSNPNTALQDRVEALSSIPSTVTGAEGRLIWAYAENDPPEELYSAIADVLARWDFYLGYIYDNYREYEFANIPFELKDLYHTKLVDMEEAAGNPKSHSPANPADDPWFGVGRGGLAATGEASD